jgi:hypothetical protein
MVGHNDVIVVLQWCYSGVSGVSVVRLPVAVANLMKQSRGA